jgi:DNA-binding response OmpR family regulator
LRGIALLVGVSELDLIKNGISPQRLIAELKTRVAELLPHSEVETAAIGAIVPRGMEGSDIELTKLAIAKSVGAPVATRGLTINLARRKAEVDERDIELTCREFELLSVLIQADGATLTREHLAELASQCNEEAGFEPIQNVRSMDVYVRRLRSKLGDHADVVQTVRGLGYRFAANSEVKVEEA